MFTANYIEICQKQVENVRFDSRDGLFDELTSRIVSFSVRNSMFGKTTNIVLTGGRHGSKLVGLLVSKINSATPLVGRRLDFRFWLSDERFVETPNLVRNDSLILKELRGLDTHVRWHFEVYSGPEIVSKFQACDDYATKVNTFLENNNFDFVVLSHALDGHLASIFSLEDARANSSVIVAATENSVVPDRLSLTFRTLARTKHLYIYSAQDSKEKRSITSDQSSLIYLLISHVRKNSNNSSVSYFDLKP